MEIRSGYLIAGAFGVVAAAATLVSPAPLQRSQAEQQAEAVRTADVPASTVTSLDSTLRSTPPFTGGRDLLNAFYASRRATPGGGAAGCRTEARDTLRVLVATVPDPMGSQLDWSFDALLGALRRAFESSGYVMDRYWFPWSTDSIAVRNGLLSVRWREAFPGVMLFRHRNYAGADATQPGELNLYLLYLVGELPTRGVHRHALRAALDERTRILEDACFLSAERAIRIVGPTFSGSSLSMRQVLLGTLGGSDTVRVISGSATNVGNKGTLEEGIRADGPAITFRATVNPDVNLMAFAVDSVAGALGIEPRQVALLSEATTQYGQGFQRGDSGSRGDAANEGTEAADPLALPADDRPLVIPFPMNISNLRAEFARNPAPEVDAPLRLGTEEPRIPLSLRGLSRSDELPPVFSRVTAPTLDLMLEAVAQALVKNDIRAVVLIATDVRDQLFLANELRKRTRSVQFITFESHRLYLWPEYRASLLGMLVISSYPLLLQNQWWMAPRRPDRLVFSTQAAQGVYNATLLQLGNPDALLEYSAPDAEGAAQPPNWLTVVGRGAFMPLKTWPSSSSYVAAAASDAEAPSWGVDVPVWLLAGGPLMGFALLLLAVYVHREWAEDAHMQQVSPGGETREHGDVQQHRAPKEETEDARRAMAVRHALFTWLFLLGLSWIVFLLAMPLLQSSALLLGLAGAALIIHLRLVWVHFKRCGHHVRPFLGRGIRSPRNSSGGRLLGALEPHVPTGSPVVRALLVALTVLYTLVLFGFGFQVAFLEEPAQTFFFFRAIQWGSGLSPIPPLFLAATGLTMWYAWELQRVRLLKRTTPFEATCERMTQAGFFKTDREDGQKSENNAEEGREEASWDKELRDAAQAARGEPWGKALRDAALAVHRVRLQLQSLIPDGSTLLFFAVLSAVGILLWFRFDRTLEALLLPSEWRLFGLTTFDVLFRFGVLALFGTTLWAVHRFLRVWLALQRCLDALSATPLLSAFERLPRQISSLTRLSLLRPSFMEALEAVRPLQWQHLRVIYTAMEERGGGMADQQPPGDREDEPAASTPDSGANEGVFLRDLRRRNPDLARALDAFMEDAQLATTRPGYFEQGATGKVPNLTSLLVTFWSEEPTFKEITGHVESASVPYDPGKNTTILGTSEHFRRSFGDELRLLLRAAEEFAAVHVVDYVEWVLVHLRRLGLFHFASLMLTIAILYSYPFQPQDPFKVLFVLILLGTVGLALFVAVQINRHEVLSRVAKNDPGRLNWDLSFVANVVLIGVIPLLTLAGSEFPALRRFLFAWLEPLLRAFGAG